MKKARARADVRHRHSGLQTGCGDDFLALVEDLAALGFELFGPLFDVELRIEEFVVDARLHTRVLREGQGDEGEEKRGAE